jgi:hypothetical protein
MDGEQPDLAARRLIAWRTSERVGALFVAWMKAVEAGRRRPLHIHRARCRGASADEQRLIAAMGVAPIDMGLGETLLAPMVAAPERVMPLARALNAVLASVGLPLPARLRDTPLPDRDAKVTLH